MEVVEKKEAVGQRYITFAAVRPKKASPVGCRPFDLHKNGMTYTGQGEHEHYELLSDEERKALRYVITPETLVSVSDGYVIDLKNPRDAANWKWLQHHPYIAANRQAAAGSRSAVYFVIDKVSEAEFRVKEGKASTIARYKVSEELSPEKRIKAAKALGLTSAESFSDTELIDYLLAQCDTKEGAERVLSAIDPKHAELNAARAFFHSLVTYKVIAKDEHGIWTFGKTVESNGAALGHTDDLVIEYLLNDANADLVRVMKTAMKQLKGENTLTDGKFAVK